MSPFVQLENPPPRTLLEVEPQPMMAAEAKKGPFPRSAKAGPNQESVLEARWRLRPKRKPDIN